MEKQIEEMRKEVARIHRFFLEDDDYESLDDYIADELYNSGYRKQVCGEWKEQNDGTHYCSNCGHDATQNYEDREICGIACAYCGAYMTRSK